MLDVERLLRSLSARRPVFHSEADFQHELAWEIRGQYPDSQVRLEVPSMAVGVGTTDIVVRQQSAVCGIELKYLTKRYHGDHDGEPFRLKAQGATDLRRYDVLKDVQRLERFNESASGPSYVIVLTNEPAYWNAILERITIDAEFRLCHGRAVNGLLNWKEGAGAGTIKGREASITLAGVYDLIWADYSTLADTAGAFRYLCVELAGKS